MYIILNRQIKKLKLILVMKYNFNEKMITEHALDGMSWSHQMLGVQVLDEMQK